MRCGIAAASRSIRLVSGEDQSNTTLRILKTRSCAASGATVAPMSSGQRHCGCSVQVIETLFFALACHVKREVRSLKTLSFDGPPAGIGRIRPGSSLVCVLVECGAR